MASAVRKISVALAGNPNSGKTTIFNNLTGARQHVGNYPGVTIEKKEGTCRFEDIEIQVVDLPGTYSLTAFSPEELVSRRYLLEAKPDVVVSIVDASNLERNLYLTVQLMELQVPLVVACNMMDVVEGRGDMLDLPKLSSALGVPVVATVGHRRIGMNELLEAIATAHKSGMLGTQAPKYAPEVEAALAEIERDVKKSGIDSAWPANWTAIKLLENDSAVTTEFTATPVLQTVQRRSSELCTRYDDAIESIVAQQRYGAIAEFCNDAFTPSVTSVRTLSDKLDSVLTHRVWGLPIFMLAMFLVFLATFTLGGIPSDWIEKGIGKLGTTVSGFWPEGSESPLRSLLVDGVIAGVGSVITFLPNILVLFLAIGILEDSGYMPRAAFIMDRVMHKIGLHGKSFIPLLLGFGCSVPAIMATRTLESRRDRLTTMLVAPLMSCGARLPIYALLIPAFFPQKWQAPVLWVIYVVGILMAIIAAKLLRSSLFKGTATPFVMELPPYRIPSVRDCFLHMVERSGLYLKKAGTIILALSMLLWVLTNYPKPPKEQAAAVTSATAVAPESGVVTSGAPTVSEAGKQAFNLTYSFAGRAGKLVEPVLAPMGFDWKIGTALVGALAAKEVFVAQMGIVYATGSEGESESSLRDVLKKSYSPLVGFCIMIFCLISAPCIATFAVTRRESGAWRWACLQFGGLTAIAYIVTTIIYQVGHALHIGL